MKLNTKTYLFFLLLLISSISYGQRIKATASLDSTNILLGDQVKFFLEIDHPKNINISFPQVPDTILGKIEVIQRSGLDTFETDNKDFQKQIQSYLITCFDSGTYRISPYWFDIDINGKHDSIPSNGVTLNVYSMPIDTSRGPTDIKLPYDAHVTLKEVTPYILGIILIGAIIFFIVYSIKRKKNNKPIFSLPKKPKEPAHITALKELDRIKDAKLWQQGKIKLFYSEISWTLREYIKNRYEIQAMEKTSEETLECFRYRKDLLTEKSFENLSSILKLADLVKFAKYSPQADDNNMTLVNSYFFINDTKKEEKQDIPPKNSKDEDGEDVEIK